MSTLHRKIRKHMLAHGFRPRRPKKIVPLPRKIVRRSLIQQAQITAHRKARHV